MVGNCIYQWLNSLRTNGDSVLKSFWIKTSAAFWSFQLHLTTNTHTHTHKKGGWPNAIATSAVRLCPRPRRDKIFSAGWASVRSAVATYAKSPGAYVPSLLVLPILFLYPFFMPSFFFLPVPIDWTMEERNNNACTILLRQEWFGSCQAFLACFFFPRRKHCRRRRRCDVKAEEITRGPPLALLFRWGKGAR